MRFVGKVYRIDAKFPNPRQLINLRFASAIILNHTPFSASGAWRAIMPRLKIDITKGSVLKTVPKSYFFRWLISLTKDAIYVLLSSKSAGHYRLFVSTGTRPGQMQKFRDTWQLWTIDSYLCVTDT